VCVCIYLASSIIGPANQRAADWRLETGADDTIHNVYDIRSERDARATVQQQQSSRASRGRQRLSLVGRGEARPGCSARLSPRLETDCKNPALVKGTIRISTAIRTPTRDQRPSQGQTHNWALQPFSLCSAEHWLQYADRKRDNIYIYITATAISTKRPFEAVLGHDDQSLPCAQPSTCCNKPIVKGTTNSDPDRETVRGTSPELKPSWLLSPALAAISRS
jgi:hypothetical protein